MWAGRMANLVWRPWATETCRQHGHFPSSRVESAWHPRELSPYTSLQNLRFRDERKPMKFPMSVSRNEPANLSALAIRPLSLWRHEVHGDKLLPQHS